MGGGGFAAQAAQLRILLIEDDEGDALLVRELLSEADGTIAVEWVRSLADARRLPRLSGLELLAELKTDPELLVIPVVMLTMSQAAEDILRSYQLHANAYVSKPVDFEGFVAAIRQIDDFF